MTANRSEGHWVEGPVGARLRLLRFSNFPSPLADVAAGAVLARAAIHATETPGASVLALDPWRLLAALAASFAVYHAGMVWNDVADRREDARTRPGRPIPSGAVSVGEARTLGTVLVAVAVGASAVAANLAVVVPLIAVVLLYDLGTRRGAVQGPLLLGAARVLNVLGGAVAGGAHLPPPALVTGVAIGYGGWVLGVSVLALGEDRAMGRLRPAVAGLLAVAGLGVAGGHLAGFPGGAAAALLWCVAIEPLSLLLGPPRPWTPDRVGALVGAGLRATLVFQAVVALVAGAPLLALLCGAGYMTSRLLARWIPPT